MTIKRKVISRKNTRNKHSKKAKTSQSNTLNDFVIFEKILTKDRVEKIWKSLYEENKTLLKDEFTQMHEEWLYLLRDKLRKPYYLNIKRKLAEREKRSVVLPNKELRFQCFKTTPSNIAVIIVRQDLYPNDADGLAFSLKQIKPSLCKVFELMEWDLKEKS